MVRTRDPETERTGPGLFFILVALVVVAVLGARYLGFYPGGVKRASLGTSQTATVQSGVPGSTGQLGQTGQPGQTGQVGQAGPGAVGTQGAVGTAGSGVTGAGTYGSAGSPVVLVYHSHTSENYGAAPKAFAQGEPGEILKVGQTMVDQLAVRGIASQQVEAVFDYPVFRDAYARSYQSLEETIAQAPTVQMVVDVHRDGLPAGTPESVTTATFDGKRVARILFVVGKDPKNAANLNFARELEGRLNEMYPGVSRGVKLVDAKMNEGLSPQAVTVYIGSYPQNTLEEAQAAAKMLADVMATLAEETPGAPPPSHS